MKYFIASMLSLSAFVTAVHAQDQELQSSEPITSARDAVHRGNTLLLENDAAAALDAYREAEKLDPEAVEIPFVTGLGYFKLGEYEQARSAFEKAATSSDDKLAHDALYSVGTTYHAEALANLEDPKVSIEKLEQAMQRYRTVLADVPDHEAARDANLKAAVMRHKLVQMMQQQEKQECDNPQPSDEEKESDEEKKKNEDSDEQQQNDQQESEQQDESEQQSEQEQQQSQDEGEEKQEESSQGEEQNQDEQQQQSESSEQKQDEEQQEVSEEQLAEQKEQNTQEQAQRRLREMMQAIRDRQKNRREPVRQIPVRPVEKDW